MIIRMMKCVLMMAFIRMMRQSYTDNDDDDSNEIYMNYIQANIPVLWQN